MRVYFSTYPAAFDHPRGGERHLMDLFEALQSSDISVSLYDIWNPKLDDADVFHFFSIWPGSLPFCLHLKKRGIPLVITPNKWIDENTPNSDIMDIRIILGTADVIILNSEIEYKEYIKFFPEMKDRLKVIKCGVSDLMLEKVSPMIAKKILDLPERYLLIVGDFGPGKYYEQVIHAIKKFPDLTLVIIGEISDEDYVNKCQALAGEQLIHLGYFPRFSKILRSAMSGSEAVLIPSKIESPSFVAMEAIAQCAKVIITKYGSSLEYLGDDAYYIDPSNVEEISNAIFRAINGSRPASGTANKFCINNYTVSYSLIYKGIFK